MTRVNVHARPIRVYVVSIAIALASVGAPSNRLSAQAQTTSGATESSSKRMADGKQWTTHNLNVTTTQSYCYDDSEVNCRQYGRLYTWESAQRVCQTLEGGWRLPTDDEWRQMATHYGGIGNESSDNGKGAYAALLNDGSSGFNAMLAGNRGLDGQYERLQAHGFYWTASESDSGKAVFYNFGAGSHALFRQSGGEKQMAISVRCVRD